jgi:hypothetical protein
VSWAENRDRFVSYILSTRRDWLCSSSRLQFYHLACLRFSAELILFVIFFTFSFIFVQLFLIYRLSSRSLRNHHLTLFLFIDDHGAMIVRWSSRRKRKLLKRREEASTKLCCVVRVSLNRKKVKVAKTLRVVIEFRFKKRELDVVLNDSKFDQFVLVSVICFVDLFQSEMMLLSSKKMKDDYEMMKFEFSNWFDDDVEIDKANWLRDSVADFDDDDLSNWQNIRVETIQKIVLSNWLRNCVEIDEKIREWVDVNQCDDDEKKSEKEESYKSVSEILLSTTIIEAIIIIIIIIIEKDECTSRNESDRNRPKRFDFYFRIEIDSNRKSTIRIIQFRFESISIRNELSRNQCLSKKKIRVLF